MNEINYIKSDVEYIEGTNHLVIASQHLHLLPDSKLPTFLQRTANLEGMKIEGKEIPPSAPFNCIEILARVSMLGKPCEWIADHTPDGRRLGNLLSEYGLPTEVTEVYLGFKPLYFSDMKPVISADEMAEGVHRAIETAIDRFPDVNIDRAIKNHGRVMQELVLSGKIILPEVIDFCNAHTLYRGTIIQYAFMAPDIQEFRERIKGKIGIVVGYFHAYPIHNMLEGTPITEPISWSDFKRVIPPRTSEVIQSIEEVVLNHKD